MASPAPPRYRLSADGQVFSTRVRAEQIREAIMRNARGAPTVLIDFDGVRSISFSFADELFGVLVRQHLNDPSSPRPIAIGLSAQAQRVLMGSARQRGLPDAAIEAFIPH